MKPPGSALLKRGIDIAVSACALVALSALLAGIAIAILLDSGLPIIFSQERMGRGFRGFRILKFRTMRGDRPGPAITAAGDSRITRIGRILRASKLDELPQLWNVLKGDMSLVGPRPELRCYVEAFADRYRRVLLVRPGMTDLASIRFRTEEDVLAAAADPVKEYVEQVLPAKLDLAEEYIRTQSLRTDLYIIMRTLSVIRRPIQRMLTAAFLSELLRRGRPFARLRRWMVRAVQFVIFVAAGLLAFLLRFDFRIPASEQPHLLFGLCVGAVAKPLSFHVFGLDRGWWRYSSVPDMLRLVAGNVFGSALGCVSILIFASQGFPRSLYIVDLLLCLVMTGGARLAVRVVFEVSNTSNGSKRTLIYGAGAAGLSLLREIRQNPALPYEVVGFIDDSPSKSGDLIQRRKVLGNGAALPSVVKANGIEVVLIAVPSATGAQMTAILKHCGEADVEYKTVPSLAEVIEGNGLATQIREVAVEDLLGRNPVRLEENQIRSSLEGKVVLVTGAAGSIGSELCRQIGRFHPAGIVGFEIAESPLFEIDREMRQAFPRTPFHPEIGSIQNRTRLDEVLRQYRPSVIYHAAAYKHVPLMEAHIFEAIENNVFGTYNVAVAAAEHGVEDFVMISSDKAVRPTNIMGATKRIAELLLLALQNGRTKYAAVRFGNVLGSNGSVIPIFKKQIAAGGPVTVTHPDMRRFFMTIPEACQLVLQAAVIAEGGQICVLDMGKAVKIVDLATNLILLSGLKPDEDIKIEFTGMRPGEKLYEELSTLLEDTAPTAHEKIRIFIGNGMPEGDIEMWLLCLREACETRDAGRLVLALKEIVQDYSPSAHLLKRVIEPRASGRRSVTAAGA
jgi:FlaA1/EpsC-like NDP-sugar epimerase/lipopolysaccharide/colanic/teichoic acid biosynthesis glycosyltransferase